MQGVTAGDRSRAVLEAGLATMPGRYSGIVTSFNSSRESADPSRAGYFEGRKSYDEHQHGDFNDDSWGNKGTVAF